MSSAVSVSCWRTRLGAASARNSLECVREPGVSALWRWVATRAISSSPRVWLRYSSVARSPMPEQKMRRAVVGEDRFGALATPAVSGLADVLKDA